MVATHPPLMEGGDTAVLALAHGLMATWRWATVVSSFPSACLHPQS